MKRLLMGMLVLAALLTACAVVPSRHGHRQGGVTVVPLLPPLVVLDLEPYYFYSGFHYHYVNDRWYYSKSRRGPWSDLPRGHYPKEVRYKSRDRDRGRGRDRDRGRGRD